MTCFICQSPSGNSSMNFVRFSGDRSTIKLLSKEEISEEIKNNEDFGPDIEEIKLCDECLVSLRREAALAGGGDC